MAINIKNIKKFYKSIDKYTKTMYNDVEFKGGKQYE